MSLYETGIRPAFDEFIIKKAAEKRDYGDYWSASSAGYCMRKVIFDRLGVPAVTEDARKHRVFQAGHIFHEFMQGITREAGLSVAQELELQDEDLMIRGHIDDLVLITPNSGEIESQHLILYDYKSQSSRAFSYDRTKEFQEDVRSYFHRMQLATYMYMLRNKKEPQAFQVNKYQPLVQNLTEARILKISKDDLRMSEERLMWSDELEKEIVGWWTTLNKWWASRKLPPCTCADREGGFMAKEAYNPYFYDGEPCSLKYYQAWKEKQNEKPVSPSTT